MRNLLHAQRPHRPRPFSFLAGRLLALLVLLLSSAGAWAQVTGYTLTTNTGVALAPMTGSTQLLGSGVDDDPSAVANIGFTFTFGGTGYTQFSVTSDGLLKFGSTAAIAQFTNALASSTNIPKLAPYWDDLATGTTAGGGNVSYLLTGTAPNRQLIVEWFVTVPRNTAGAANARYQATLTETSNTVAFTYGAIAAGTSYSVGLRGSGATTDLLSINTTTNVASTTANNSQTAAIAAGKQYVLTPPVPPACQSPTALAVANITSTSANITFTAANGNTSYTVTYTPTGGTATTVTPAPTASPVALTSLTPGTTYTVSVTANCSGNNSTSSSTTVSFTTLLLNDNPSGAVAIPLTADCTTPTNGTNVGATTTTTSGYTNPGCGIAASPKDVWYTFTTAATGPAATAVQINITGSPAGQVRVFSTTGGAAGPFTQVGCSAGSTNNTAAPSFTVNGLTASTTYYIFVSGYGSNDTTGPFTLCVTNPPACGDPSNATISAVTATSATVSFTPGSGNTSFTLTATPTTGSPASVTGTASPLTVTGLTPSTNYTLSLVASCAGGATTTPITGTITTLALPPANDECTNAVVLTSATTCTATSGTVAGATQSLAPILCNNFTASGAAQDVWYQFTATGTTHTVAVTGTFDGVLEVLSGACGSTANVGCSDVGGNNESLTLTSLTAGTVYRIRYYPYSVNPSPATFTICVTNPTPPPACPAPTTLTTNTVTSTSANVTFTAGSGNTSYTVTYTPTGGTATTVTPAPTASPVPLTGLTPNTTYTVSVTANCSASSTTATAVTTTFTTAAPVPANDLCANAIVLTCGQTVTGTTQGATTTGAPSFATNCGTSVTTQPGVFYSYVGTGDIVTVSTCSGPTATSGDTKLFVLGGTCGAFTCIGGSDDIGTGVCAGNSAASAVTFTSVTGTTYYFYVQGFSSAVSFGLNVTCVAPPSCPPVTSLATNTVTSTSANVTFTAGSNNTSYTVTYTPTGGTATTVTPAPTASPVPLTGLTPNTTYTVSVTANCSASSTTATAVTTTFTTPSLPPANDECTNAVVLTSATTCTATSGTVAGATQSLAPILCNGFTASGAAQDVWYQFTATGTTHTVAVTGTFDGVLEVLSGACGSTANVGCSDVGGNNESLTLTSLTAGTVYRIRYYPYNVNPTTATFTICVTNPAPVCNAPTALTASAITTSSATVNFTGSASAANGYTVTTSPATTTQTLAASATSVSFSGLTASTLYTVSIVSNCSATATSSAATVSFTTATPAPVCTAPGTPSFSAITQTSASVSFTPSSTNVGPYTVTATNAGTAITATGTASPISLTGLTAGTAYSVTVTGTCSAASGGGTSPASTAATLTTTAAPVCNAPTALTASAITSTSATVSFTGSGSATSYTVTTSPVTTTQTLAANATSVSFTGLSASTAYTVTIVSNCAGGQTASATTSFTTTAAPITDLTVANGQNLTASGAYNNITVQNGGTLTLTGATSATGAVQVQTGGLFITNCQALTGAGSFTLQTGAELRICNPAGITATGTTGAIQLTGTRTFASDASYTYNGTAAQVTGAGLPATVRNLTVNNATGLTLSQAVSITQVARLQSGDLATNGQGFTLLSSAAGTALVDNTGGVVTGTGTMQRAITNAVTGPAYRHFSSPVVSTTLADLTTTGFAPTFNTNYNTSATPGSVTPFPTVFGYDQARVGTVTSTYGAFDKGWFSPASASAVMQPTRGYTVNAPATATPVDFVGTFNNAAQNSGSLSRGTDAQSGWQLLGNPYPAPLDWNTVVAAQRPGMDAAMYVYQSTGQYAGTYRSYDNGVGASPLIDAGSGYFTRVTTPGSTGSVNLTNTNRVTTFGAQPAFGRGAADSRPQLHLLLAGASLADDTYLYLESGATSGLDSQYDAVKLANPAGMDLASLSGNTQLAINGLAPLSTTDVVVPLALRVPQAGSFSFEVADLANFGATTVYLRDALTGSQQVLAAGTRYTFTLATATAGNGRFSVVFRAANVLATQPGLDAASASLYPNPAHASFTVMLPPLAGQRAVQATLVNALGQVVMARTIGLTAAGATAEFNTQSLATGVYTLQLKAENQVLTKRVVIE